MTCLRYPQQRRQGVEIVKSDLKKAHQIVDECGTWNAAREALRDKIAEAVMEGIAWGRQEGLRIAAQALPDASAGLAPSSRPGVQPESGASGAPMGPVTGSAKLRFMDYVYLR